MTADPFLPDVYTACPDGTLVTDHYIKWQDSYYIGYSIGADMWIRHRVKGDLSEDWIPIPGTFHEGSQRSSFRRNVPMEEVERYVRISSFGMWRDVRFGIVAYTDDGMVGVIGSHSPALIELMESGMAPRLELWEAGRAGVIGDLPWIEMSSFSTETTDLPLPRPGTPQPKDAQ